MIRPYMLPYMKKLKRGPAVTIPKDAGLIISYTGLNKNSKVVELGGGSGFLTVQLARIAKEVVSYERKKEFAEIIEMNAEKMGLKNVKVKVRDIVEEQIDEKDADLVTVDIKDAEKIAEKAYTALKKDGYLAGHCLNIEQARVLYLECEKYFREVMIIEGIVREYEIKEKGTRPKHLGLVHTAYLVFARK
ncbi:methyltransferase domain-containing protein [Candidatus Micrarchaeota archaeon]|nr:methyltransferase domain-containing protein [Candidatus Micrarchaeota archaeon]